ncbi:MAG TPA: hypothetical protein VL358_04520 [Caulobacteraceae bacterium]|jgi:hypothetical protein|nr:hypothetical protein [Caulobacteraceae bacterium]
MAAQKNLSFFLGEDWQIELTCRDADGGALDLTGAQVKWRLADPRTLRLDLVNGDGVVLADDPTTGVATIVVTAAMQGELPAGLYSHEAQVVLADGTVSDQAYGTLYARESLFTRFS